MKVNGIYERDTQLEYITIDKCRKTELLGHRIRIYHLNDTNYVLFFIQTPAEYSKQKMCARFVVVHTFLIFIYAVQAPL